MKDNVTPAEAAIHLVDVSKVFGKIGTDAAFRAVDGLNLDVRPGQMLALLGKTGCGKSTIFNMIAGLTAPSSGTVRVDGRDPFAEFDSFRGKMAIVFQNDRLLPWRTAIQNVELGLEMLEIPVAERRATAQLWLTKLGLGGHENDYPHALSGGMRQRVSIARAFATNANILLCDEPFSALDESTAGRLRAEFVRLVKENGKTAVFITHSIREALEIGDRIVVLKRPAMIAYDVSFDAEHRPGGTRGYPEPDRRGAGGVSGCADGATARASPAWAAATYRSHMASTRARPLQVVALRHADEAREEFHRHGRWCRQQAARVRKAPMGQNSGFSIAWCRFPQSGTAMAPLSCRAEHPPRRSVNDIVIELAVRRTPATGMLSQNS